MTALTDTRRPILEVDNLHVTFDTPDGRIFAVNGVNLELRAGEILGVVGESGCGKTATAKAIMGILPEPPGRIRSGSVRYLGRELTQLPAAQRKRLMGREMAWIPQDPLSALNPSFRVGYQIAEAIRAHSVTDRVAARAQVIDLLAAVGIPSPAERARFYPHELSGGMRQRVLIAMAIALRPSVLFADEPTSALDVTIQAEIMTLLRKLQAESDMGLVLISHDCALVSAVADRVVIMYAGRIVEEGPTADVFRSPAHPYTRGLLRSMPSLATSRRLEPIPGSPPHLRRPPVGCPFLARCPLSFHRCELEAPAMVDAGPSHKSACFRVDATLAEPSLLFDE